MSETPAPNPPAEPPSPRVFISYCSEDKSVADAVCAGLERNGMACWIAPRDVRPGQNWGGTIVKSIAASKVMVLIFSKHTNNSRHVMNEIERAVSHRGTIIPFRIDNVKPSEDLELFISSCHWLDAFKPPLEPKIAELVTAVSAVLGQEGPLAAPVPAPAPAAATGGSRGLLFAAGAVAVLAVLAAAAFFFVLGGATPPPAPAVTAVAPVAATPAATPLPVVPAADPLAEAKALEDRQDFLGALEVYGRMMAADPGQTGLRTRAGNAIARLLEHEERLVGDPRAIAAVRAVAESNLAAAQKLLGLLLRQADPAESLAMFKKAAEQGDARSMAEVGLMLSNGDGAPADLPGAATWLKRSADAGFPEGMLLYAECLLGGKGTPVDEPGAAALYSKAAALGNVPAKSHLARMYQKGVGVPAADPKKALALYQEAAAQGFLEAQGRLGAMFMSGEAGEENPGKAVQLWEDGAGKGDTVCMLFYAKSLEAGAVAPPNKTEAAFWYRKAAQKGNPDAVKWCVENQVDF